MHLDFLLEEESARAALLHLVPRILGAKVTADYKVFQGKKDLLDNLPARLKGYRKWMPGNWRLVVLVDEDRQDCLEIKSRMEGAAIEAGLPTLTAMRAVQGQFRVINRVAVEELEAWFFGDVEALCTAYPGVPSSLGARAPYRDPDAVKGGTWEALERVLQKAGYYRGGIPKVEVADQIAAHMNPDRNTSASFRVFRDALRLV
jgi:hypothetical protein